VLGVLIVNGLVGLKPAIDVDVTNDSGTVKLMPALDRRRGNGGSYDKDVRLVVLVGESFFESKRDCRLVKVKRLAIVKLRA
jgi:hypothetical protein